MPDHTLHSSREHLLGFVQYLRSENFIIGAENTVLLGKSLLQQTQLDVKTARANFRAICCGCKDEWQRFDVLFSHYWRQENSQKLLPESDSASRAMQRRGGLVGIAGSSELDAKLLTVDEKATVGAGKQTTVSKADFRFLKDRTAMQQVESLAEKLSNEIRPKRSRRKRINLSRGQLNLGRTLKASTRTLGVPLIPYFDKRKTEVPGIVILHDVSHSMTFNNPMLIRFTRGLVKHFNNAEAFVFHTKLFRVTSLLKERSIDRMQQRLEENNRLWLGGTCIADSIQRFNKRHAKTILKRDSLVVIISDGFDSNHPGQLAVQLQRLKSRCKKVIWLNPMLEREGFNADKEEVWNLQRNVDTLLPAHSLDALKRCVRTLSK